MKKTQMNKKGITLTSLIIYITIMFVVLAIIMRVTTYYTKNMSDVADTSFEEEFEKFNMYMLQETNKSGNYVADVSEDNNSITFTDGNTITFQKEDGDETGEIYFNELKICENVGACAFTTDDEETTGKTTITVNITINGTTKDTQYVITTPTYTSRLPEEFQEVEYIESTGIQYIDTKYMINENFKYEINVAITDTRTSTNIWPMLMGAYGIADASDGKNYAIGYTPSTKSIRSYQTYNFIEIYNIEYKLGEFTINQTKYNDSRTWNGNPVNSVFLFAVYTSNEDVTFHSIARVYNAKIYNSNTLVRDYIPCYSTTTVTDVNENQCLEGTIGLYDLVEGKFYTNQGTGEFLKGKDKDSKLVAENSLSIAKEEDFIINHETEDRLPKEFQEVMFIKNTGGQYIDTGYIPNSNTGIELKISANIDSNVNLYCARGNNGYQDKTYTAFLIDGKTLRIDYYDTSNTSLYTANTDEHIYKQEKNKVYVDNVLVKTINNANFSCEYNLYLMASHLAHKSIDNSRDNVSLYYCSIWDNGRLIREYVPCYSTTTVTDVNGKECPKDTIGMYDLVNDEFYTNQGTGEFIKGPEVD